MEQETHPLRGKRPPQPDPTPADTPVGPVTEPARVRPTPAAPALPPAPAPAEEALPADQLPEFARQFLESAAAGDTAALPARRAASREEPPAAPRPGKPTVAPVAVGCPRCSHAALISPETLGLCPSCGFCRSVAEDLATLAHLADLAPAPVRRLPFLTVPGWVWPLTGGMVAVVGLSWCAFATLPPAGRQTFAVAQLTVGLIFFFVVQWWTLFRVAAFEPKIGLLDLLFVSPRLWSAAFRLLPDTQWQLSAAAWSLAVALAGGAALLGCFGRIG